MKVREDKTLLRDGSEGLYGFVDKPDFVIIAPIDGDRVHLVQQFRYPIHSRQWEFPQGSVEGGATADPADVARTELEEETGLTAGTVVEVGRLFPLYGTINQCYRIFLATGLSAGTAHREITEQDLVSRWFALSEFEEMIKDGTICDAGTVATFGMLKIKGLV
ncbi:NUDIX hydrolase [Tianweitania sp. Rool2]|uniref:GDP-mannose pyrophosphatase n=2 Tax=Oryzicola mucosus TaxID=2767425 RepID=A0A8J6PV39_9HYPH|nr:NUDIX hydrolase [Oryzicola mucosus]